MVDVDLLLNSNVKRGGLWRQRQGCSTAAASTALLLTAAAGVIITAEGTAVEESTSLEIILVVTQVGGGFCGIVGINGRLGELCICVGSKSVLDRSAWALGALNSAGLKQQSGNSGLGGHGSSWLCSA